MEDDRAVVERQLGRPTRAFRRVVRRCPFGRPAVTEQEPYDSAGEPFPTTYYLTCPHLVAAVSRLEAAGGVEGWSARAVAEPELAASLLHATAEQQQVRRRLAAGRGGADGGASLGRGIAGAARPEQLKCLHAHAAFALARPGYRLGEEILGQIGPLWPEEACCTPGVASAHVPDVELARHQWEDGHRRLKELEGDPVRYERVHGQVDALVEQLRRRVGSSFTLAELAESYQTAERWAYEALAERAGRPGWTASVSIAVDSAFHLYARGARDYRP